MYLRRKLCSLCSNIIAEYTLNSKNASYNKTTKAQDALSTHEMTETPQKQNLHKSNKTFR